MEDSRTLFIGLGGTGGKVIRRLYHRMSPEQRMHASYLYLDLDSKDINEQLEEGITTVRISSADTVAEVAESLGTPDGVYNWLPAMLEEDEGVFRASTMDDGASQIRYKSRLCLAKFLKKESNALTTALKNLSIVGAPMEETTLRVMIVSSVAGGTGAGTFLDIALYIRKFFREHKQTIVITGLFACPDLFAPAQPDEGKRRAMFANAYAAIRELNAMNIAVSGSKNVTNDYGKSISMEINSRSEGRLFDSKSPDFTSDFNAKPYDLLYFVDEFNNEGGILPSLNEYYEVMADIAYTRLYSPLEESIRSDESNEVTAHINIPTAIYGGAGYGKIIYPYEDILRYLSERKVAEDLGIKWTYCERDWANYCSEQRLAALEDGENWVPTAAEREQQFLSSIDQALVEKSSPLHFLRDMLQNDGKDRVSEYMAKIRAGGYTKSGLSSDKGEDGKYGFAANAEIQEARRKMVNTFEKSRVNESDPLSTLSSLARQMQTQLTTYCTLVDKEVPKRARHLSSAIFSTVDTDGVSFTGSSEIGLHSGLLMKNKKDVHPIAARYLLYKFRSMLRVRIETYEKNHRGNDNLFNLLDKHVRLLDLAFDEDPYDDDDIRIVDAVEQLKKKMSYKVPFGSKKGYTGYVDEYKKQFRATLEEINKTAMDNLMYLTYVRLMESMDVLISQYEGFFENLEQFETDLKQRMNADEIYHDRARTRYIYVGASAVMKDYYYSAQPSVSQALAEGNAAVYAAEGKGVYEALVKRTIDQIQKKNDRTLTSRYQKDEKEDDYKDMGGIFDGVVKTYGSVLREKATFLQADVITALVHQVCQKLDLDQAAIQKDASVRNRFHQEFRKVMADLIAKSRAMISYDIANKETYYKNEKEELIHYYNRDVSKEYYYVAMGTRTADNLQDIFPAAGVDPKQAALDKFQEIADLEHGPIVDGEFSPYEMVCFSAVHCLQPIQINKFNENKDYSYYHHYVEKLKEAVATDTLSLSPHIDKRWHRRGVMPYISRNLEEKWRKQLMQAFLYLMLVREIQYATDKASGRRCFIYRRGGKQLFLQWPMNRLILQQNISRILEYLSEDEALVEQCEAEMMDTVDYQIELLSNYTGDKAYYKQGMTKSLMLSRLRSNTMASFAGAETVEEGDEDAIVIKNASNTMGGVLQIAWLVHQSEENLGEDRDYGEALLDAAADVIDRFCQAMYGNDRIENTGTQAYRDYVDLYNTTITNVLAAYVMAQPVKAGEEKADELRRSRAFNSNSDLKRPGSAGGNSFSELEVPDSVRMSDAFNWITANWHKKGVQ